MAKKKANSTDTQNTTVFFLDFVVNEDGILTAFKGRNTKIVLPDIVKGIGSGVFSRENGFGAVSKIIVPEGVEIIQNSAFEESDLENITLPSTLKIIGESAFSGCKKLRSITIPDGVRRIEDFAFSYSGLQEIYFPRKLKNIGWRAFYDCKCLENVIFPKECHPKIEGGAFYGCAGLKDENGLVIIRDRLEYFAAAEKDSPLYVDIPDHVAFIGEKLFTEYPVVHLTMPLDCPEWPVDIDISIYAESILQNDGCSISFRDTDGKIAAKVILATAGEHDYTENLLIASIRRKPSGGFDFEAYDRAFFRLERPRNKTVLALVRLMYPYELTEKMKEKYTVFLRGSILDVFKTVFDAKLGILGMGDVEILKVLEEKNILDEEVIPELIEYAQLHGRSDYALELLEYQKETFGVKDVFGALQLFDD